MSHRTLVLFYNDQAHMWSKDPELGQKIIRAMHDCDDLEGQGGRVIECAHADTQTVMLLDSYNGTPVAHGMWSRNETNEQRDLKLLREWADKMGYSLRKKSRPAG